jgi:tripartite-type tricarboxylate transporter receptor subunit TctC
MGQGRQGREYEARVMAMKLRRRNFLQLAATAAALPAVARIARGDNYPIRPVQIIVAATPGAGSDVTARLVGQWLSERLDRPFIVENRPGAGTNIGTELVVRALPDGYTLLLVTPANAINATIYDNLNFNFTRDIAPVAGILRGPEVMEVNPSVPVKTIPEFIAYAKANPGKLNFGSSGIGSGSHLAGELFKSMTGVEWLHVPYRGPAQAQTALLSGQVQVYFGPLSAAIEFIRPGKLRALAVTSAMRSEALPGIPTVAEFVPGYEASGWFGLGAPKNTPVDIIDKLNREINASLADAKAIAQLADLGGVPMAMSPAEFGKFVADETEKWAKVIKLAGIKAD